MSDQLIKLKQLIKLEQLADNIFSDVAEQAAEVISETNKDCNKSSQLRKFYDELLMWNDKVWRSADPTATYAEVAPFVHMMRAKVAYAKGRRHVDDAFVGIFNHMIGQINSPATLKHAKLFFEAMLGFRKALEDTSKGNR